MLGGEEDGAFSPGRNGGGGGGASAEGTVKLTSLKLCIFIVSFRSSIPCMVTVVDLG